MKRRRAYDVELNRVRENVNASRRSMKILERQGKTDTAMYRVAKSTVEEGTKMLREAKDAISQWRECSNPKYRNYGQEVYASYCSACGAPSVWKRKATDSKFSVLALLYLALQAWRERKARKDQESLARMNSAIAAVGGVPMRDSEDLTPYERKVNIAGKSGSQVTLESGYGFNIGQNFYRLTQDTPAIVAAKQGSSVYVDMEFRGRRERCKFDIKAIKLSTGDSALPLPVPVNDLFYTQNQSEGEDGMPAPVPPARPAYSTGKPGNSAMMEAMLKGGVQRPAKDRRAYAKE